MKGFYDRGHYDLDTYEEGVTVPRSATDLKIGMGVVTTELDYLATDPTGTEEIITLALEGVRSDGTLSTAIQEPDGGVKTWGMRYGRHMSGDVVQSADATLQDVRSLPSATGRVRKHWTLIKKHIHPAWFSFINSGQTD